MMPPSPSPSSLAPCPFCGNKHPAMNTEHDADGFGMFLNVKCRICNAQSGQQYVSTGNDCPQTRAEVREAWNRRAALSAVEALGQAEPVAWRHRFYKGSPPASWSNWIYSDSKPTREYAEVEPLYASPAALQQQPDDNEGGPLREGWHIMVGPGHSGFGVYAVVTEYPDEGSVCLATFDPKEYPDAAALQQQEAGSLPFDRYYVFGYLADALQHGIAAGDEDIRKLADWLVPDNEREESMACAPSPTEPADGVKGPDHG